MMKLSLFKKALIATVIGTAVILILLITHNIDQKITPEDQKYMDLIISESGAEVLSQKKPAGFDKQIDTILAVQNASFDTAPGKGLIPMGQPREPRNLYETDAAYCGDRARFIEKALRYSGFDVRFVSIYERKPGVSLLQTLLTRGNDGAYSHAVVEVLTDRGWLVVDTRTHFISLDDQGQPRSLRALQSMARAQAWPQWSDRSREDMFFLMKGDFWILYGLYSRHGRFYAPYTPMIPDYDFPQLLENLNL